jgi:translation initiation factor IF-3
LSRKPFSKKRFVKKQRVNEEIRIREVRLIDEEGSQIGIVPTKEALQQAINKNLDLVEISPDARPPVAKIMDYGKYQYNKKKQERKNRKNSKKNETKGIRLGLKTEKHDLEIKRKKIEKFLNKDFKVAIDLVLKGREKMYQDKAREVLSDFLKSIETPIIIEDKIKKSPRGYNVLIKQDLK